jgi:integrase
MARWDRTFRASAFIATRPTLCSSKARRSSRYIASVFTPWLSAGVDIRTVADYLGHGDPGFTLRTYAHLMPDAADRARKAMNAFFDDEIDKPSALYVPSERTR